MTDAPLTIHDYPLAETAPERVTSHSGKPLDAITLDAVERGDIGMEDLRITPGTLLQQAEIARDAGRAALARNFERAAEMAAVPAEEVMRIYELLRPGRASGPEELHREADRLETDWQASTLAAFVRQAADYYQRRGLFRIRY